MAGTHATLRASDVMIADPICVEPSATLRQLARILDEYDISGAPVVDPQGRVIGVVSKTDLIRRCAQGIVDVPPGLLFEVLGEQSDEDVELIPEPLVCVQDFMSEDPLTVTPETSAKSVARMMFESRIHRVIVVDDDRMPLGVITSLDLLGVFHS